MFLNRVIYGVVSFAAVVAFLLTDSSAALFLCLCLASVPVTSFTMLFIAAKRVRFDYDVRESCIRGQALQITVKALLRPRFLAGSVSVAAEIENSTFRKKDLKRFVFKDLTFTPYVYDYVSENSGRIAVRIKSVRLIDMFGVFSLGVSCHKFSESIVSPVLYENTALTVSKARASVAGEISLPEKGNDNSEVYNVRDYVSGDSMRSIHWKLTGKFGVLKTKEFGSSYDHQTLILVDLNRLNLGEKASDAQLNAVLDAAVSVSHALKEMGYVHSIGWFDDGAFRSGEVRDGATFVQTVSALMSIKVNENGDNDLFFISHAPECAAFTKIIYITTLVSQKELMENASCSVTALCVRSESGVLDKGDLRIVSIDYKNIGTELTHCVL